MSIDSCNTARKLGAELAEKIEDAPVETNMSLLLINNKEMKTEVEPCQNYQ